MELAPWAAIAWEGVYRSWNQTAGGGGVATDFPRPCVNYTSVVEHVYGTSDTAAGDQYEENLGEDRGLTSARGNATNRNVGKPRRRQDEKTKQKQPT